MPSNIKDKYSLTTELLGEGAYGKVYKGYLKANENIAVAVKTVPKTSIKEENFVREEIKFLQRLDHPNIVKYHEGYESD